MSIVVDELQVLGLFWFRNIFFWREGKQWWRSPQRWARLGRSRRCGIIDIIIWIRDQSWWWWVRIGIVACVVTLLVTGRRHCSGGECKKWQWLWCVFFVTANWPDLYTLPILRMSQLVKYLVEKVVLSKKYNMFAMSVSFAFLFFFLCRGGSRWWWNEWWFLCLAMSLLFILRQLGKAVFLQSVSMCSTGVSLGLTLPQTICTWKMRLYSSLFYNVHEILCLWYHLQKKTRWSYKRWSFYNV